MFKSFNHKGLEDFFLTGSTKGIQAEHKNKINIILTALNVASTLEPLKQIILNFINSKEI